MEKRKRISWVALFLISVMAGLLILGCSHLQKGKENASEIVYEITPMAEVTKVSYFIKKLEGTPKLFFEIGIKNISKENHKYRAVVLLNEGPSGSALFPAKEMGKLDPGKELSLQFPIFYDKFPKGFTLMVETYD
jgi:hypothetical protein